ncbi:MAG: cupin domain-containing protein [Ignavibacteria bacterium]|nr:cupin domain-containing protein [Ignavibacteria bacterium]
MRFTLLLLLIFTTVISQTTFGESKKFSFSEDTIKFRIIDIPLNDTSYFRIIERGKSHNFHSGRVYLNVGCNVGEHSTENYEELVIILKGSGEVENQFKERYQIKEGQVIYIPPNSSHNVYNTGSEPLIYIYIVTKAY